MTDKEILQKVMEKYYFNAKEINIIICGDVIRVDVYEIDLVFPNISLPYQCIIFSREFAIAFWGKGKVYPSSIDFGNCFGPCREDMEDKWIYRWQYHLQQIILEEEPLKYLEKFLKD